MSKKNKEPEYKLPDEVIEAVINGQAVLFLGAGVSKQYGAPLWDELGNTMLLDCYKKGKTNYKEYENLRKRNYSPLQKVTIAAKILNYSSKDICEYLDIVVDGDNRKRLDAIADCLWTFKSKIYTTNADMILENQTKLGASYKSYYEIKKEYVDLDELSIIHVHGSVIKPESIIFTIGDYFSMYRPKSDLEIAINQLFKGDNYIIFIGYGLNDFELLRQVLDTSENHKGKIFMLNEYYKDEQVRLKAEKKYYKDFGINVIPYYIDDKGYDAFINVLNFWKTQIKDKRLADSDRETELKFILSDLPNENSEKRFKELETAIKQKRLFKLIEKSDYACKWFGLVNESNRSVKDNFIPAEIKNGFVNCTPWPWLNCLYAIIKEGQELDDDVVIDVLEESLVFLKINILYLKNYEVFNTLYKLLFSNKRYLEKIEYLSYTEMAFCSDNVDRYSSVVTLKKGFKNLGVVESDVFFKLFNYSVESFKEMYMLDFFYSKEVFDHVHRYPTEFMEFCISYFEKLDMYDSDLLGPFVKLEKESSVISINRLMASWLEEATMYSDRSVVIEKIHLLLNSENETNGKIAVYLSTVLKYEELLDYKMDILSKDYLYLDLAEYIEQMDFPPDRRECIAKKIHNTKFETDEKSGIMLKNNLLKRIPYNTIGINLDEIDRERERILVNSYGKRLYSYSDGIDYADYIYQRIKDYEYYELSAIKEELKNRIVFFSSYWNEALSRYFVCGHIEIFINNIDKYKNEDFIMIMNECVEKYANSFDLVKKYVNCVVDNVLPVSINIVRSFIYLCKDAYRKFPDSKKYLLDIMDKLDLRFIIDKEKTKKWDFNKLINSVLFLYYEFLASLESNNIIDNIKNYPSAINDYIIAYNFRVLSKLYDKNEVYSVLEKNDARLFYISFAYGNPDKESFLYMTEKSEFIDYLKKSKKEDEDRKYYYNNYTVYILDGSGNQSVYDKMIEIDPFYTFRQLIIILCGGYKIYNTDESVRKINDIIENIQKNMNRKQMRDQHITNDILKCMCLYDDRLPKLWDFAIKSAPYFKGYNLDELIKVAELYHDNHSDDIFEILKEMLYRSNSLAFEDGIDNVVSENFYQYFNDAMKEEIRSVIVKKRES